MSVPKKYNADKYLLTARVSRSRVLCTDAGNSICLRRPEIPLGGIAQLTADSSDKLTVVSLAAPNSAMSSHNSDTGNL